MLEKNSFWSNIIYTLEAALMLVAVYIVLKPNHSFDLSPEELEHFITVVPWLILTYVLINNAFDTNVYYNQTKSNILFNTFIVQFIFSIILCVICTIYIEHFFFDIGFIFAYFIFGVIISSIIHVGIFTYFSKIVDTRRVLIIGKPKAVYLALENFERSSESLHRVTHVVMGNYLENLKKVAEEVDVIFIAGVVDPILTQEIYNYLIRKDKMIYLTSTVENSVSINAHLLNISDESIIQVSPYYLTREQAAVKRVMDIVISIIMLVLFSPVIFLTVIALRVESKGPVFYKQERVTLGNRVFQILKFRSMVVDAEEKTGPVLAKKNDSRVTKVGQFIRATRIDEIPQLINVLKGEMSIIGPRPERPNFVDTFSATNPFYHLRHNVRAGITGYAQVYGKYTSNFESKLKFDLLYIKKYSFLLDIKLLLKTILTVFNKLSSQGESNEKQDGHTRSIDESITILK
ncbi:TPA: sugar transferase [Streptococcus suis]|nr:sugar transferase [Streptococcus suis]